MAVHATRPFHSARQTPSWQTRLSENGVELRKFACTLRFGLRVSAFFRHSAFGIRFSPAPSSARRSAAGLDGSNFGFQFSSAQSFNVLNRFVSI
jgi:hypothetical protein